VQQKFNVWEQKKEISHNFQDPVEVYLMFFSNKINFSLFHSKYGVQSNDELQMDILLSLIPKNTEIDDPQQKLVEKRQVDQSHLIIET
jgi:hypothetical protein